MRSKLFALVILCTVLATKAQGQWGIHGTFIEYERLAPSGLANLVVGMDHDFTNRTAMALDLNIGMPLNVLFSDGGGRETLYKGYDVSYDFSRYSVGGTYRSLYFLSSNSNGFTFYLGPTVGVRYLIQNVNYVTAYYVTYNSWTSQATPPWARPSNWKNTVFPIAMRWGWRGALDGISGDLYMSLGGVLGGVTTTETPGYLDKKDMLTRLYFQLGYTYAIGW